MGKKHIFTEAGLRERVGFLDEIRGLCILLMVIYHGAYDIVYIFGVDIPAFHWPIVRFAQPFVAGIFVLISGVCCRFSRSNLRRGLIALGLGAVMSVVTIGALPALGLASAPIYFGILHFLGAAMILFALLHPILDLLSPFLGILLCLALCLFTYGAGRGYLGLPGLHLISLPAAWRSNPWLIPLGFSAAGADHFPLLPWLFVFFAGSYLGIPFARREMPDFFYRSHSRFLSGVGRHTILVYLLHQPVVYGILYGVFYLINRF